MLSGIEHLAWVLTGGKDPRIHNAGLGRFNEKVRSLAIPEFQNHISKLRPRIKVKNRKYESRIYPSRMTIEQVKTVYNVIPFHISGFPIKGLTLPKMRITTRIKRFIPRMAVSKMDFKLLGKVSILDKIPPKKRAFSHLIVRFRAIAIPVPRFRTNIHVRKINAKEIPNYFIRIKPTSFRQYSKPEIMFRKNSIADSLNIPRVGLKLIAIFRKIDVSIYSSIEYDHRTRSLKMIPGKTGVFIPDVCDIVVTREIGSDKIHVARYRRK
jgi:hypothetical protein